tara:strand:+ start:28274 stop:29359 length:1086 start_codon:yes stop_codon:yes gene_type:complete
MHKLLLTVCLAIFPCSIYAASPDLDTQIGQMLIVGFRGMEPSNTILEDIQKRHIGGVVLFSWDGLVKSNERNIKSPKQVKQLIHDLQATSNIPLFIAIDQEGGIVSRLNPDRGFPVTPSHAELGQKDDLPSTYQEARKIAATLKGLGINLNFAPVIDTRVDPNNFITKKGRTFSDDPEKVAEHALAYIQAHRDQGTLCSIKHFCGHGSSTTDSHWDMVDVTDTWDEKELIPFANIIKEDMADIVMTAHVFQRKLDPDYPATLSGPIINNLLRNQLGYRGVVITDDIQMDAIRKHFTLEDTLEALLNAGVDIILIANATYHDEHYATQVIQTIKKLITQGRVSEKRIAESFARIQALKQQLS